MRAALAALLLLGACKKAPPPRAGQKLGPFTLTVPESFVESGAIEKKVLDPRRTSRVWRDPSNKMVLSLAIAQLPHQAEWAQYPVAAVLNGVVDQAMGAGDRAGMKALRSDRREEGAVLRYELDSGLSQAGMTLFTFSRAAIWLEPDGMLVNATAVCTATDETKARCPELLQTLKFEAPAGARALDGGA